MSDSAWVFGHVWYECEPELVFEREEDAEAHLRSFSPRTIRERHLAIIELPFYRAGTRPERKRKEAA